MATNYLTPFEDRVRDILATNDSRFYKQALHVALIIASLRQWHKENSDVRVVDGKLVGVVPASTARIFQDAYDKLVKDFEELKNSPPAKQVCPLGTLTAAEARALVQERNIEMKMLEEEKCKKQIAKINQQIKGVIAAHGVCTYTFRELGVLLQENRIDGYIRKHFEKFGYKVADDGTLSW